MNEYLGRYKEKYASGAGVFCLDKEEDFGKLKNFCGSQSLFEKSKLGIVHNFSELSVRGGSAFGGKKADLKEFVKLIKENLESKNITLILIGDKKPTKDFAFLLKKPAIPHSFENLEGGDLKKFLDLEIKKRGMEMDIESKDLLLASCGANTCDIVSELEKLALLDEKKIDRKILEKHIDLSPAMDIFNQLNKIRGSHSVGEKLRFLDELLASGADPTMVFNMSAASPYLNQEQKIKMADYDAAVKSGKLEYDEVLLSMMLE